MIIIVNQIHRLQNVFFYNIRHIDQYFLIIARHFSIMLKQIYIILTLESIIFIVYILKMSQFSVPRIEYTLEGSSKKVVMFTSC